MIAGLELTVRDAIVAAGATAVTALLTWVYARNSVAHANRLSREAARDEIEQAIVGQRDAIARLETEKRQLSAIVSMLPKIARVLASSTEKREIVPLLGMIVEHLLEPKEVYVFLRAREDDGLVLAHAGGDRAGSLTSGHRVPMDAGRIATSARYRRSLDPSELSDRSRYPLSHDPALALVERRLSVCVPILAGDALLGVIAVGGANASAADTKRAMRVVSELGAAALVNAMNFRTARLAAESDPLTRLFNRRTLSMRLEQGLEQAHRRAQRVSVFLFDVDHFKHYNDRNGHLAGDQALRSLADIVRRSVRGDDIAARYGGEEFAVVLLDANKQEGLAAADKLRAAIADFEFAEGAAQPLGGVTISGGVATYPEDGNTAEELFAAADAALYAAKQAGRNRVQGFVAADALATGGFGADSEVGE